MRSCVLPRRGGGEGEASGGRRDGELVKDNGK
jgi:hypothetical protein